MKFKNFLDFKTYLTFFFGSILATIFIYCINFYVLNGYSEYYICNELINLNLFIFDHNLELKFPFTCDSEYYTGFNDLSSILKDKFSYQYRPLYFVIVNLVSKLVSLFFVSNSIFIYIFSNIFIHLLIANISFWLIDNSLKTNLTKNTKFLVFLVFLLNPILKYGLFDPSHQTFTILNFAISFRILCSNKNYSFKKTILISVFLGFFSLINKVFFTTLIVLFIKLYFQKKNDFTTFLISKFSIGIFLFYIPTIIYTEYIKILGFTPYDSSTEFWKHFVWLKDYLLGKEVAIGMWYCQSIPENFACYLIDTTKTFLYLFLLIFFLIFKIYIVNRFNNIFLLSNVIFKNLIIVFAINFTFWSFIGWYPPIRFNLYSIFPFLFVLFLILIQVNQNHWIIFSNTIFFISYLIFLKHWNYPNILDLELVFFILFFFCILLLLFEYKEQIKIKN